MEIPTWVSTRGRTTRSWYTPGRLFYLNRYLDLTAITKKQNVHSTATPWSSTWNTTLQDRWKNYYWEKGKFLYLHVASSEEWDNSYIYCTMPTVLSFYSSLIKISLSQLNHVNWNKYLQAIIIYQKYALKEPIKY